MKTCPSCSRGDQKVTKVYQPRGRAVTIRYYDCPKCGWHYKTEEKTLKQVRRQHHKSKAA